VNAAEVVQTGELRWNIKQSFRDYVGELPDGEETWTGDAGGILDGDLVFPAAGMTVNEDSGRIFKFTGAVRYAGYRGMLRVDLRDPWLEVGPTSAVLTADTAPPGASPRRTRIAEAAGQPDLTDAGAATWRPDSTTLTAAGAALLGSVYPPGTEAAGFALRVLPA
jgi:hypothetical protein